MLEANSENKTFLGWATVAENAIVGREHEILVFLNELFPNARGQLETNPQKFKVNGNDRAGYSYALTTKTSSTVTAVWINRDSNRLTAPQVQKGERVMIYRFGGSDKTFYWEPANLDNNKRVQEAVVMAYAAKPESASRTNTPTTPENAYTETRDGINGLIETRMSEANGEISPWLVQYNGKDGTMVITDQKGNLIQIDTKTTTIEIQNADRSHIQLSKDTINISCENTVNLSAQNEINIKTKNYNIECETYTHKAKQVTWEAEKVEMTGNVFTLNYPTINLNGQCAIGGFSVASVNGATGNGEVAGNMITRGNQEISGSVQIQGTLSANGPVSFPSGGSAGLIAGSYIDT